MGAGFIKVSLERVFFPFTGIANFTRGMRKKEQALDGGLKGGLSGLAEVGTPGVLTGPVSQPLPADLAAETLHRLDAWLGLSRTAKREWGERLPAVIAASLALTTYAWSAGLKPIDLRVALVLGLLTAVLGYYTDGE